MSKKNIYFVVSHPIQYFAPLYQTMSKDVEFNMKVFFLSDETIKGNLDKQFGVLVKWDIPLLEGYNFEFLKNQSLKPSIYNGFLGLINFGIFSKLKNEPKGLVLLHGWSYLTMILSLIAAKLFGHQVGMRGEAPITREYNKSSFSRLIRKMVFKTLFKFIDKFYYIGENNKEFYKMYGVNDSKLFYTPYCVDNDRFQNLNQSHSKNLDNIKKLLGIQKNEKAILFSGKLIEKKRPLDLLSAFSMLENNNIKLFFMGDGNLRNSLEIEIKKRYLQNKVVITGFVNQSEIYKYYLAASIFVMCSDEDETWGLSTNEAMNFALPVVLYDSVGCSKNLIDGNGIIVPKGDTEKLSKSIFKILEDENNRIKMGIQSQKIISKYSYIQVIEGIKNSIHI